MIRLELDKLIVWKRSTTRKPLIIRGARQVGKTWLMKEFARTEYRHSAYINFESNDQVKSLFTGDFDIARILRGLEISAGLKIEAGKTLLIFDEIQEAPAALTALKYFQENAPEYHIICAGSLLGVAMNRHTSFPVGKVEFLDLYPLSFPEFAQALGEEALLTTFKNNDWPLIKTFKFRFIELLKQYYCVGGMPEAVSAYSANRDFTEVRNIQKRILMAYEQDFSKHAPNQIVPRIRMLWNSIPAQLAKESKKFIYGIIKEGARAKEYELAMSWLMDSGLITKINRATKPAIPLKAYEDPGAFKLFLVDLGLLAAMTDLDIKTLLVGNELFEEFKGALTEQYVLQQLLVQKDLTVYYWAADNGRAEVDFLIQYSGQIIPMEVKAEENLKSKSLRVYYEKFSPQTVLRTSMSDFRKEDWMTNLPLYAIAQLRSVIDLTPRVL
jgi:predicted AAA+ superfamily ATPase